MPQQGIAHVSFLAGISNSLKKNSHLFGLICLAQYGKLQKEKYGGTPEDAEEDGEAQSPRFSGDEGGPLLGVSALIGPSP